MTKSKNFFDLFYILHLIKAFDIRSREKLQQNHDKMWRDSNNIKSSGKVYMSHRDLDHSKITRVLKKRRIKTRVCHTF